VLDSHTKVMAGLKASGSSAEFEFRKKAWTEFRQGRFDVWRASLVERSRKIHGEREAASKTLAELRQVESARKRDRDEDLVAESRKLMREAGVLKSKRRRIDDFEPGFQEESLLEGRMNPSKLQSRALSRSGQDKGEWD